MIVPIVLSLAAAVALTAAASHSPAGTVVPRPATLTPLPSHAYAEGAPPGFTGGFSEQSCDACHFHAAPNTGPGKLAIEGVPEQFEAGQPYRVTIALTQPGLKLAGFQLAARFKDDGTQAGALAKESEKDARVSIEAPSGVQYAGQRREGTTVSTPNESRWTVMWTAPSSTRTVVFHVAANGANGDERADGDYVYTLTLETSGSRAPEFRRSRVTAVESSSSDRASSASSGGSPRRPDTPSRAR
ncbi:MAG TPA: choice-of-anchor V domain-containing protein [Vicinamibacterales bacterium]